MSAWGAARRILCIRLDNMGDVLMSTPAMQALKESVPGRHLTLLTSHGAAGLARHLPMVDMVWAWDAPWVKHGTSVKGTQPHGGDAADHADRSLMQWVQRVAAGRFDAAVIFTVYSQSPLPAALLCTTAGIPLRLAHCRENPYGLLTDWVRETEPNEQVRHEVQRQLDLVATTGAGAADTRLRFRVLPQDQDTVARRLAVLDPLRLPGAGPVPPCVVVHPGATAASRRWPAERFAEVARALATRTGALVVVTGSASEAGVVDAVRTLAAHPRVVGQAGALTLGEMGALIQSADLLVSNNSGPVHLAAALGTPVVDLYALTNPQHTPWQVPHRTLFADVPCRYCYKSVCPQRHHRCLGDVPAQEAIDAALALLAGARADEVAGAHIGAMPLRPAAATRIDFPALAAAQAHDAGAGSASAAYSAIATSLAT
jgi:lipopolysaccharide heptosyltransferase II